MAVIAPLAAAQSGVVEAIAGAWLMEDLYTVHMDDSRLEKIEAHPIGAFTYEVEFNRDGTGSMDGDSFVWTSFRDEIQWRFEDGSTYSLLVRFLTLDYFLVYVTAPGARDDGAVVSGLARRR
jgi:hypothetical protein